MCGRRGNSAAHPGPNTNTNRGSHQDTGFHPGRNAHDRANKWSDTHSEPTDGLESQPNGVADVDILHLHFPPFTPSPSGTASVVGSLPVVTPGSTRPAVVASSGSPDASSGSSDATSSGAPSGGFTFAPSPEASASPEGASTGLSSALVPIGLIAVTGAASRALLFVFLKRR